VVKKDRQQNCYTLAYPKKYVTNILPDSLTKTTDASPVYFTHNLVEPDTIEKQVRLERLVRVFPYPITTESRRRKLQRFLDLPQLTIALIWLPLIAYWLTTYCPIGQRLSIAIDPTSVGVYQSVHARIDLAEEGYPIILVFITQIRKQ
jgi:hypothetical protein